MRLVAVRHLLTAWNREGRLQGRADIPILPPDASLREIINQNRRQLEQLGPFDLVCCSTRRRTIQTASAYGFTNPQPDPLLDEFDFGDYEGRLREEMLAAVGQQWLETPHTLELGEKMADLEKRIREFLYQYRSRQRVLIFGHGCWLRGLLSLQQCGTMAATNRVKLADNQILRFDLCGA